MTDEKKIEKNDENIKKMAKYLRERAKMLDVACPVCNNPIFQLKTGEKLCVICERKVIFENDLKKGAENTTNPQEMEKEKEINKKVQKPHGEIDRQQFLKTGTIFQEMKNVCLKKLASLTDDLEYTKDPTQTSIICENILKILKIINFC